MYVYSTVAPIHGAAQLDLEIVCIMYMYILRLHLSRSVHVCTWSSLYVCVHE